MLSTLACRSQDGAQAASKANENETTEANAKTSPAESGVGKDFFQVGTQAPNLELPALSGEASSLKKFEGKYVLLNFWATWCVPCVAEMVALQRVSQIFADKGLVVLGINVDDAEHDDAVKAFLKEKGLTFPVLRDREMSTPPLFKCSGFPETFLLSPQGKFLSIKDELGGGKSVVRVMGDRPWDSPAYIKALEQAIR